MTTHGKPDSCKSHETSILHVAFSFELPRLHRPYVKVDSGECDYNVVLRILHLSPVLDSEDPYR